MGRLARRRLDSSSGGVARVEQKSKRKLQNDNAKSEMQRVARSFPSQARSLARAQDDTWTHRPPRPPARFLPHSPKRQPRLREHLEPARVVTIINHQSSLINGNAARRFDTETGLYYYRARYYNPYIGRFLQTDPIGYGDGMNLYRYCRNDPLNWADPSGLRTGPNDVNDSDDTSTRDADGDGIPDCRDSDMDGDGIPNERDSDTDGDGVPDGMDRCPYMPGSDDEMTFEEILAALAEGSTTARVVDAGGPSFSRSTGTMATRESFSDEAKRMLASFGIAVGGEMSGNWVIRDPSWFQGKGGGINSMFFVNGAGEAHRGLYGYTQEGIGVHGGGNFRVVLAAGKMGSAEDWEGTFYGLDFSIGAYSIAVFVSADLDIVGVSIGGGPGVGMSGEKSEYEQLVDY